MIFWNPKFLFENPVMFKFTETKDTMRDINGGKTERHFWRLKDVAKMLLDETDHMLFRACVDGI